MEAKSLRVIDFNYDYSLAAVTSNSFDISNPSVKYGKLTLNSVVTRGKAGLNLIPPISFQYDLTGSDQVSQTGVTLSPVNGTTPASFTTTNGNFNVGDLIMSTSLNTYCGVVTAKSGSGTYTYTLANSNYTGSTTTATVVTTKNPPYNKDAYDVWGMYKSDYSLTALTANANLGRMTTPVSSSATDAWSLRYINSQLGGQIKVGYGPDIFSTSVIPTAYPFMITSPTLDGANNKISFTVNTYGYPINSILQTGYSGKIVLQDFYSGPGDKGLGSYQSYISLGTTYTVNTIDPNGLVHATLTDQINPTAPLGSSGLTLPFINILAGNISSNLLQTYGGGIRVNSLTFTNSDNSQNITNYNYNISPLNAVSSGVTSYLPYGLDIYDKATIEAQVGGAASEPAYQRLLFGRMNSLYAIARELPPPGVMYQYVTVSNQIKNPDEISARTIEGSAMYEFEVFRSNMVGRIDIPGSSPYTTTPGRTSVLDSNPNNNTGAYLLTHNLAIIKFLSSIGNLRRVVKFDPLGNKISETVNHYLHDNIANLPVSQFMQQYKILLSQPEWNYQGYIQERYSEVKDIINQNQAPGFSIQATLSARETYPCINTGQTVINYINGTQTTTTNLGYDYYSGALTNSVETDAYGNNTLTESVPAYTLYPAMGPKIDGNSNANKNMLTQVAESRTWKVDVNTYGGNKLGLIAAAATTWSDLQNANDINGVGYIQNVVVLGQTPNTTGDVWRKQSSYKWMPVNVTTDGTTPTASFSDLVWANPSTSNSNWKNFSSVTLYDVFSKSLEESDLNGNYEAARMNYGDKKVVLTGGPARFYEIAYSGAEDAGISQTGTMFVKAADGTATTVASHTGSQSLLLGVSGKRGFLYSVPTNSLTAGRNYQASVWVKPVTGSTSTVQLQYDINGTVKSTSISSGTSTKTANGWYQINLVINGSDIVAGSNTLSIYCINNDAAVQAYIDDFRFQPSNATTTAYVYDSFSGELTYSLDNNNIYTNYVYDAMGRLVSINKEKLGTGIFKTHDYQYNYSTAKFASAAITNQGFYKNNCPPNNSGLNTGTGVQISVPGGQFTSFISQTDANNQATNYAQDYANTHGTCVCTPSFTFATGIPVTYNSLSLSGTTATFNFVFTYPSSGSPFTLGNITTSCCFPSATRTVPVIIGSNVYNTIFNSNGTVQIQLVSGVAPTGSIIGVHGIFDLLTTTYYSAAASGTYTRNNCTGGQVGSSVTYNVSQYTYNSTVSQAAADQLAQNDVTANGQNYANANGICTTPCTFTWGSNFTGFKSATLNSTATTVTFGLQFVYPTSGYTGGTLGTISSGCRPSGTRSMTVTDGANSSRTWYVTIYSTGSVTISLSSGPAPTNSYPPVVINGTFTK